MAEQTVLSSQIKKYAVFIDLRLIIPNPSVEKLLSDPECSHVGLVDSKTIFGISQIQRMLKANKQIAIFSLKPSQSKAIIAWMKTVRLNILLNINPDDFYWFNRREEMQSFVKESSLPETIILSGSAKRIKEFSGISASRYLIKPAEKVHVFRSLGRLNQVAQVPDWNALCTHQASRKT